MHTHKHSLCEQICMKQICNSKMPETKLKIPNQKARSIVQR